MQPDVLGYILFLGLGAAAIFLDGLFLRRAGATYLSHAYPDGRVADSANRLITVLFHLVMLGALPLLAVLVDGTGVETVAARFGILFLLMAVSHGVTVWTFGRLRARQREQRLQDEIAIRTEEQFDSGETLPSLPRPTDRHS